MGELILTQIKGSAIMGSLLYCIYQGSRWSDIPTTGHDERSWCHGYIFGFVRICNYDLCCDYAYAESHKQKVALPS